jgi:hypothetical protein
MKILEHLKAIRKIISKFGLIIDIVVLLLFLDGCRYHREIEFIDDPLMSYHYYLSQHGILKLVHGHNQLFLYDCNLKNSDMIDNFVGTMDYDVTNWSNDTIEVCLSFEKSEWRFYKEKYHELSSTKATIGKFVIKYNYRLLNPGSSGLSNPDIIDSVQTNNNCTSINLFNQGKFIECVDINKLFFSNNSIFFILTSSDNNITVREIILTGRQTKKNMLNQIFSKYREVYCK